VCEEHLVRRGQAALDGVVHLVEDVQALVIPVQQLGRNAQGVALEQLAPVVEMHAQREGGVARRARVRAAGAPAAAQP
jgi:hypothetical protein